MPPISSSKKSDYARRVTNSSAKLAQAIEECSSLASMYVDRGYAVDGANPIVADDISGLEVAPEDLAAFVTMIGALNTVGATVPELLGWSALLNKLRSD